MSDQIRNAITEMNALPDISDGDSKRLQEFVRVTAREVKAVGGASAATTLEMIGYIRELERSRIDGDDYVAWCRYVYDESGGVQTIETCDSDTRGAFKVYRAAAPSTPEVTSAARAIQFQLLPSDTETGAKATQEQIAAILSRFFGTGETRSEVERRIKILRGVVIESGSTRDAAFVEGGIAALENLLDDLPAAPASPSPAELLDKCAWTLDDSNDGGVWETSCGEAFQFTDGGPTENNFVFCYKCGKRIEAAKYSDFASAGEESK